MDKFEGTPGPWSVDAVNYRDYGIVSDANGEEVTTLPAERAEHDFNAMLIAAAPELLEALQVLFNSYKALADSGDAGFWSLEDYPEGQKALAAIAKALGK